MPTEQKHVETNLKANIAGVTLLFSFVDEDLEYLYNQTKARPYVHYLGANFQNNLFMLQVLCTDPPTHPLCIKITFRVFFYFYIYGVLTSNI